MINNVHKKFLMLSYVCFFACFNLFSMKTMADFNSAFEAKTKNWDEITLLATNLCHNNPKHFHQIALKVHPDKTASLEKDLQDQYTKIFKAINESVNRDKPIPQQEATPEEKKLQKILNKTAETTDTIDSLKGYSLPIETLETRANQIRQEISHSLIDNSIEVSFGLILKNLAPGCTNNTSSEEILDTIKDQSTALDDALTMHADYRKDLQQATAKNYTNAQKKLQSLLKKEKK